MRTIKYTNQFKKDFKRENKSSRNKQILENELLVVVALLATDKSLLRKYCDHRLTGNWRDPRDCHIKPDLVLIYRKPDINTLELVRIGSHAQLSL